jgi:PilZ domain-containing protein
MFLQSFAASRIVGAQGENERSICGRTHSRQFFHYCRKRKAVDAMLLVRVIAHEVGQDFQDRRTMRRFDMRLPAALRIVGLASGEFATETQNVSARGVFFYLDRTVDPGTRLEVTLTFPPHVTLTDPVRVRFTARVLRVEDPLPSSRVGVAAAIEDYEFLESDSPGLSSSLPSPWGYQ